MINLCIFGQTPSKKSSQQIVKIKNKLRVIPNPKYMKWEKYAVFQLKKQAEKINLKTIDKPVHVRCKIYRRTKRRVDLVNLLQSIHDVLTKAKIIKDDRLIESVDGSRKIIGIEEGKERAEIFINVIGD
ncbi:MAG: RusA family crossover junction endodeoxyribonuclease [Candidatus Aminicenantes bacterium]|nr:RusA family crossover junction endodeoxyribonuclease [Candidatus Aminicenantes bacterium]